jgi:protoheme IX farnesyltransferase
MAFAKAESAQVRNGVGRITDSSRDGGRAAGLRAYVDLVKPRMVFLLTYVALASGVMHHPAGAGGWLRLALSVLAVALGSMGANAITAYIDSDIDAVMARTRYRPVPRGRVSRAAALAVGVGLVVAAAGLAAWASLLVGSWWALFWLLFGVLDNVLIYSAWLKRRSPLNIIAGAPSGGATAAVAAAAVTGRFLDAPALILAALVVLWTPVHIWSLALRYRDDYRRAKVPMLPVVISVAGSSRCIACTSILLALSSAALGLVVAVPAALSWALLPFHLVILGLGVWVMCRPTEASAWWLFKFTSPYLGVLCTALAVGSLIGR